MNYYNEIKNKLIDNEIYCKVKDNSKERNTVITYYEIGRLLHEAGKHYGDNVIGEYSEKLMLEVGKKYNRRTLFRMRQFYNVFSNEKVSPLVTQLTWTNCLILIPIKKVNELHYYANQVICRSLSKRQLEEIIKNKEYERLPIETKNKLISNDKLEIKDLVPDPILIKNKNNIEIINEKILHNLILEDIEGFMKELGNNLSFIGSEYKIKVGDRYNYIDLLLYNFKYKCFVVIELKVVGLNSNHTGQIQKYMNYVDRNVKNIDDNKTVGIIICKKNNQYVIDYCSDSRIIAREYALV